MDLLQPFIEACARHKNEALCRTFIEKLTDPEDVVESLLLIEQVIFIFVKKNSISNCL